MMGVNTPARGLVRRGRAPASAWKLGLAGIALALVLGALLAMGPPMHQLLRSFMPVAARPAPPLVVREPGLTLADFLGPAPAQAPVAFPLAMSDDRRHLVDQDGRPFFLFGDAAWSLIAQLRREDVERYLQDRRARGFNTLLVSLIEHYFATNAPANIYGEPPFLAPGDFSRPNERYFAHADWVLTRARELGFLVLLTPAYMGAHGGPEGWYQEMAASGPEILRAYGRFVGERYRDFPNILWVAAGDYDPPDRALARAVAQGIADANPHALQTAHGAPGTPVLDHYGPGEPWLQINNVYTYGSVPQAVWQESARRPRRPLFLLESGYENEQRLTPQDLRAQAWGAVLAGAMGYVFGNNPIWHFDGPGSWPVELTWQEALDGPGTRDVVRLHEVFAALPWWRLEPDPAWRLLTSGRGRGDNRAIAASTVDGSVALVYLPTLRRIGVRLEELAGPMLEAAWYDPSSGYLEPVAGGPFPAQGARPFEIDRRNDAGDGDWVLILRSRP